MATYADGSYLTNKGTALVAKLLASEAELKFVKATLGDGDIPDGVAPEGMTDLGHYVMDGVLSSITHIGDEVNIGVQVNSENITQDFYVSELGLWATDPDEGTILYAYLYIGNHPEYLRTFGESVRKIANFNLVTIVSGVQLVSATIDPNAFVTIDKLAEYVPKSQLGVPNGVATLGADGKLVEAQRPEYSAADIGAVPNTLTINGHQLTGNIELDADDVDAIPQMQGETGQLIGFTAQNVIGVVDGASNISSAENVAYDGGTSGLSAQNVQAAIDEVVEESTLEGVTTRGATTTKAISVTNTTASTSKTTGALVVAGGIGVSGTIWADQVYGAVWNDYAEYREAESDCSPGDCVCEGLDGRLRRSTRRRQKCPHIVSDTYGIAIGETDTARCPIALTGRVLAKTDGKRYKVGDVLCAGPHGRVTKMRWWERVLFPDRIVGVVSGIPMEDEWGDGKVKVNGRIWVNVR